MSKSKKQLKKELARIHRDNHALAHDCDLFIEELIEKRKRIASLETQLNALESNIKTTLGVHHNFKKDCELGLYD